MIKDKESFLDFKARFLKLTIKDEITKVLPRKYGPRPDQIGTVWKPDTSISRTREGRYRSRILVILAI